MSASASPSSPSAPLLVGEALHKRYGGVHALRGRDSRCGQGRCTRSSARMAPASRRCSRSCRGRSRPTPARSRSTGGRPGSEPDRRAAAGIATVTQETTLAGSFDRGERLSRPSDGQAARHRLARHAPSRARRPAAARSRRRPVAARPQASPRPAADGRDRARSLDRRTGPDPRRADELLDGRRGGGALRPRPQAAPGGCGDHLRLASAQGGLRPRRPRHRPARRPYRGGGVDRRARPAVDPPHGRPRARGDRAAPGAGARGHRCAAGPRPDASAWLRRGRSRGGARRDRRAGGPCRRRAERAARGAVRAPPADRRCGRGQRDGGRVQASPPVDPQRHGIRSRRSEAARPRARDERAREPGNGVHLPALAGASSHARRELPIVRSSFDGMHIRAHSSRVPVATLSGGNQQKVVLGSGLRPSRGS